MPIFIWFHEHMQDTTPHQPEVSKIFKTTMHISYMAWQHNYILNYVEKIQEFQTYPSERIQLHFAPVGRAQ